METTTMDNVMTLEQTLAHIDRMVKGLTAQRAQLIAEHGTRQGSWPASVRDRYNESWGGINALETLRMGLQIEADQRARRAQEEGAA